MFDGLRPEARAALLRWRGLGLAVVPLVLGFWWGLTSFGILRWLGWTLVIVGLALGWTAVQRLRFQRGSDGPGVVEIRERQVAYLGPLSGGVVNLDDLSELRLDPTSDPAHWLLLSPGQTVAIPVTALGAEALFDLFATLPGIRTGPMLSHLSRLPEAPQIIWQRAPDQPRRLH